MTFEDYYAQLLQREELLKKGRRRFVDGITDPMFDEATWSNEQQEMYKEKLKKIRELEYT